MTLTCNRVHIEDQEYLTLEIFLSKLSSNLDVRSSDTYVVGREHNFIGFSEFDLIMIVFCPRLTQLFTQALWVHVPLWFKALANNNKFAVD